MTSLRRDWLIPGSLILIAFVPVLAGGSRIVQLTTGAQVTSENARFFADPIPILFHIVGASLFAILAPLQFSPRLRRYRWHRVSGRITLPAGIVTAVSGTWVTVFSQRAPLDGDVLSGIRLVVGVAMTVFLVLGYLTVRQRDFTAHRRWMLRGYALGFGAGTQLVTQVPWILLVGPLTITTKTYLMAAAWLINVIWAEWLIRRRPRRVRQPVRAGTARIGSVSA